MQSIRHTHTQHTHTLAQITYFIQTHVDWLQKVTSRPPESWLCVLSVLICMWVCVRADFGVTWAHFPFRHNCNCCLSFTSDQTDQRFMMSTYFCLLVSVLIGKNYAGELILHCFSTVSCWVEDWESHLYCGEYIVATLNHSVYCFRFHGHFQQSLYFSCIFLCCF